MKRYVEYPPSSDTSKKITEDNSDFCKRWYEKFGELRPQTMQGDEFMKRLKEMRDFE